LHFDGHNYAVRISGITAGTIGVGVTRFTGHAYNMRSASDIVGNYTVTSVSAAVGGGEKVARLHNSRGQVHLQLRGPQIGLELSTAVGGVTISIR
jgi:hypothetical protein